VLYPHIIGLTIEGATNMTRKHFQELVDIIVDNKLDEIVIQDIMRFCKRHNSRFDKATFMDRINKLRNQ
jgi:predicted site-specific integrase-resolvase